MKKEFRVKKIRESVYDVVVYFCTGHYSDFVAWQKKERIKIDENESFAGLGGACFSVDITKKDGSFYVEFVIWVSDKNDVVVLSHEVIHLVSKIFERRSVPFDRHNEETVAQYHSFWMRRLL